jgi:hypothetical protein
MKYQRRFNIFLLPKVGTKLPDIAKRKLRASARGGKITSVQASARISGSGTSSSSGQEQSSMS